MLSTDNGREVNLMGGRLGSGILVLWTRACLGLIISNTNTHVLFLSSLAFAPGGHETAVGLSRRPPGIEAARTATANPFTTRVISLVQQHPLLVKSRDWLALRALPLVRLGQEKLAKRLSFARPQGHRGQRGSVI